MVVDFIRNNREPLRDEWNEGNTNQSPIENYLPREEDGHIDHKKTNVDHFFLAVLGIIVFFMQCGFAFLEAGAVRSKNTVNILIKNWLDTCLGAIVYWAIGFGLTWGDGGNFFCGTSHFLGIGVTNYDLSKFFFQFTFAATASTLVGDGSLIDK